MCTTGNILKKLRKENNFTMDQLAKILNEKYNLNINKSMISKWENGTISISNTNANAYCKFFNVTLDYLIYGVDPKTTTLNENDQITDDIITTYNLTPEELLEYNKIKDINRALFFNKNQGTDEDKQELDEKLKKIFIRSLLKEKEEEKNNK